MKRGMIFMQCSIRLKNNKKFTDETKFEPALDDINGYG